MPAIYGYLDPGAQTWMVLDEVRTSAFADAIRRVVRPGDVVLDIGSGSGVLALLAARAGASKVYAVERTGMAELISQHAVENGFEGVVEVVRKDFLHLSPEDLASPPRVVVSEMLGHFAPDENQHAIFQHARRLAHRDAVFIPQRYRLVFAPAHARAFAAEMAHLQDVHGVKLGALADRMGQRVANAQLEVSDLLGPEVESPWSAVDAPLPSSFTVSLDVTSDGDVNLVASSFIAELAPEVTLRTCVADAPTHWRQTLFPIDPPLPCRAGDRLDFELRPRLITDRGTWTWKLSRGDDVRIGDAMQSFVGDKHDLLLHLGVRFCRAPEKKASPLLDAWAAALGGRAEGDLDSLATRLLEAMPDAYPDIEAARQAVVRLLRAADALA